MDSPPIDLDALRREIDAVDAHLLQHLCERVRVARAIGGYKRRHGLPVVDLEREAALLARIERAAAGRGLDPRVVVRMWRTIIEACTAEQVAGDGTDAAGPSPSDPRTPGPVGIRRGRPS